MTRVTTAATIGVFIFSLVNSVCADPAWTKSGDCMSCHTSYRNNLVDVFNHDDWSDPQGQGQQKLFRLERNQTKTLLASLGGLNAGDRYATMLTRLKHRGILHEGELKYIADCNWAEWGGNAHTFTDPAFYYTWDSGPSIFPFELAIKSDASYDYYELVYAVAGKDQNGELFYSEEPFYLQVVPAGTPPVLVSAVSRKTHGSKGDFDINLPLDQSQSGIECRLGGPTRIILTFSEPIAASGPSPATISAGSLSNVTINGSTMVVEINNVPDQSCLAITLNGIADLSGTPLANDNNVHIRVLLGDTDGNKLVTILDLGMIKSQLLKPVTGSNAKYDVDIDGVITITDLGRAKSNLSRSISCP